MSNTIISFAAIACYLATATLLAMRLTKKIEMGNKTRLILLGLVAMAMHATVLAFNMFTPQGINFGFFNAVSLLSWLIALILLTAALTKPVENLGIVLLPLAALAISLGLVFPSEYYIIEAGKTQIGAHILISIVAYSLLSIAAVQAILLAIQDRHLHNKHPGGFIRTLPPLQTMETLLFQMIGLGFILYSLSLASGALFIEDMFAQHLVHKTVFSITAWMVFAILLWGRWQYGWRGKKAIRWTLGGFSAVLLAYLGSKLVLEVVLK